MEKKWVFWPNIAENSLFSPFTAKYGPLWTNFGIPGVTFDGSQYSEKLISVKNELLWLKNMGMEKKWVFLSNIAGNSPFSPFTAKYRQFWTNFDTPGVTFEGNQYSEKLISAKNELLWLKNVGMEKIECFGQILQEIAYFPHLQQNIDRFGPILAHQVSHLRVTNILRS